MPEAILEYEIVSEPFDWCDMLDMFRIPHYSNENTGEGTYAFKFWTCEGSLREMRTYVVLWANRPEPTEEELLELTYKDREDEEDDDETPC